VLLQGIRLLHFHILILILILGLVVVHHRVVVICFWRMADAARGRSPTMRSEACPSARSDATAAKAHRRRDKAKGRDITRERVHFQVFIPIHVHVVFIHCLCCPLSAG
jgi:hypothetical protein